MFRGLLLLLCVLAVTAPPALAEDEIFVDPGSPSGKEYALPIESARKQAAGDAQSNSSSTNGTPLFGEGVDGSSAGTPSGAGSDADRRNSSAGGDAGSSAAGDAGSTAASRGGARKPSPQRAEAGSGALVRAQAASPDGGTGTVAIVGAGAGVLLLGGAIGLLLRRRRAREA